MSVLKQALSPIPAFYRRGPIIAGAVGGSMYASMQVIRLASGEPFKGTSWVFNLGDPVLAIYAAAAALALCDLDENPDHERFYHSEKWYLALAAVSVPFAAAPLIQEPEKRSLPAEWNHALLLPLLVALLGGVIPHLLFDVKTRRKARAVALGSMGVYVTTLTKFLLTGK